MAELAYAADSKSADFRVLWVRVPPPVPTIRAVRTAGSAGVCARPSFRFTVFDSLSSIHCLQFTVFDSLSSIHCLRFTVFNSLSSMDCRRGMRVHSPTLPANRKTPISDRSVPFVQRLRCLARAQRCKTKKGTSVVRCAFSESDFLRTETLLCRARSVV